METTSTMDIKRVNAAVKIWTVLKRIKTGHQLKLDLVRLTTGMTSEEYTEYRKRIE